MKRSIEYVEEMMEEIETQKFPNSIELFGIVATKSDVMGSDDKSSLETYLENVAKEKNCSYTKIFR